MAKRSVLDFQWLMIMVFILAIFQVLLTLWMIAAGRRLRGKQLVRHCAERDVFSVEDGTHDLRAPLLTRSGDC